MKQPVEKDKKYQHLIDELSDLMNKSDGGYGPFLMEELQKRLECVVKNFNEELSTLIEDSFKKWRMNNCQLRDLMATSIQIKQDKIKKEEISDPASPYFIKNVEFGPIRPK